jgi:hypothetical protein
MKAACEKSATTSSFLSTSDVRSSNTLAFVLARENGYRRPVRERRYRPPFRIGLEPGATRRECSGGRRELCVFSVRVEGETWRATGGGSRYLRPARHSC